VCTTIISTHIQKVYHTNLCTCSEAKKILERELGAAYASVKIFELDEMGSEASGTSSVHSQILRTHTHTHTRTHTHTHTTSALTQNFLRRSQFSYTYVTQPSGICTHTHTHTHTHITQTHTRAHAHTRT